jgi:spore coat polysaccharide biosynthesis predicted glycosyltransferase SpsG
MTRLLLRADASPVIGAGHIARGVAYAERAIARGWEVSFSGRTDNAEWLASRFDELGVPRLPPADDGPALGRLADGFDVVLVDHYGLVDLRKDVNNAGAVLVSVEDDTFGRRAADVVADCGFAPAARPEDGSPTLLRGVAYAPLRDVVLAAREKRQHARLDGPLRVTVVLGGGGVWAGLVGAILSALRETGLPCAVRALARGDVDVPEPVEGQSFEVSGPGTNLHELLVDTDLAVSAAGVTLLELCCLGVPTAVVQLVDNQVTGYRGAVALGLAAGLGTAESLAAGAQEAGSVLSDLLSRATERERLAATAAATVDGLGADRVLDAVAEILA